MNGNRNWKWKAPSFFPTGLFYEKEEVTWLSLLGEWNCEEKRKKPHRWMEERRESILVAGAE
jgi:hypothetical protein